jgi:hypothetical protein
VSVSPNSAAGQFLRRASSSAPALDAVASWIGDSTGYAPTVTFTAANLFPNETV